VTDTWDPSTYERFKVERRLPFDDLLRMVEPCPSGRVVDLGCGTGALTAELHQHCRAAETVGVDSSASMLEGAPSGVPGLRFEVGDISTFDQDDLDVVFSNAALHWTPGHETLIPRLVGLLGTYGQIAFQVPANFDHPSHLLAHALAGEEPYLTAFVGAPPASRGDTVLGPEHYAGMLDGLGALEMSSRLQVYDHHLPSTEAVVDWVRGTLLNPFRAALGEELFDHFVAEYRRRLVAELGDHRPYFYAFKRILVWARLP
jgi:trans-aconitate 2-methyltransferase